MTFSETLRTALHAIAARRLRSGLTVLGIMIGITAVILTVGLGQGAQRQVAAQINALGTNLLVVSPGSSTSSSGIRAGRGSATTLTAADAAMLADPGVAPDVRAVAATATSNAALVAGGNNWTTSVLGTTPSWLGVRARSISSGRFLTAQDVTEATPVVVLGATTASNLFGSADPVGRTLSIGGQSFTVVGELASAGTSSTLDQDDLAIVPSTTFAARLSTTGNQQSVSSIYLEAASPDSLSAATQEAQKALAVTHDVTADTADFTVTSQQSLVQTATSTTHTLTILLGGIVLRTNDGVTMRPWACPVGREGGLRVV